MGAARLGRPPPVAGHAAAGERAPGRRRPGDPGEMEAAAPAAAEAAGREELGGCCVRAGRGAACPRDAPGAPGRHSASAGEAAAGAGPPPPLPLRVAGPHPAPSGWSPDPDSGGWPSRGHWVFLVGALGIVGRARVWNKNPAEQTSPNS